MATIHSNNLFTNRIETNDGDVYWVNMDKPLTLDGTKPSWLGKLWKPADKETYEPGSWFLSWTQPGKPQMASLLMLSVLEAMDGKRYLSPMRSSPGITGCRWITLCPQNPLQPLNTNKRSICHMVFFWLNFGHHLEYWQSRSKRTWLLYIFHVNWFLKDEASRFLWLAFEEITLKLGDICQWFEGEDSAQEIPIWLVPK